MASFSETERTLGAEMLDEITANLDAYGLAIFAVELLEHLKSYPAAAEFLQRDTIAAAIEEAGEVAAELDRFEED